MSIVDQILPYVSLFSFIWAVGGAAVGAAIQSWRSRKAKDAREARQREDDRCTIADLAKQVAEMRADLDAIKIGNLAEYQESISTAHTRYCVHGEPLTISGRGRINAMMRSLSALDDEDGTYQAMVDDINRIQIYQPHDKTRGTEAAK